MTQLPESQPILNLSDLQKGLPAITPAFGAALAEAGAICLSEQGHQSGVALEVEGGFSGAFVLLWPQVTDQMRRCWNDQDYATEQGAYGVALLLIQRLTSFTVVERSRRGTGFDYWLGNLSDSAELPFEKSARLEVSGIRRGDRRQVRSRVTLKEAHVQASEGLSPAYIAVIEFSQPLVWVVEQ
jgi:hypothetical protein